MVLQLVNVVYVLVAIAMIALILMQRGSGAAAGSGFGGGASATVFGSRGASNFLSKSTKWLGITFFVISMGMAMYASNSANRANAVGAPDLGVMGEVPAAQPAPQAPAAQVPSAPAQPAATVPAAPVQPAPAGTQPAPPAGE